MFAFEILNFNTGNKHSQLFSPVRLRQRRPNTPVSSQCLPVSLQQSGRKLGSQLGLTTPFSSRQTLTPKRAEVPFPYLPSRHTGR